MPDHVYRIIEVAGSSTSVKMSMQRSFSSARVIVPSTNSLQPRRNFS